MSSSLLDGDHFEFRRIECAKQRPSLQRSHKVVGIPCVKKRSFDIRGRQPFSGLTIRVRNLFRIGGPVRAKH